MTASNSGRWLRLIIYLLIVATTVYLPRNLGWTQPMEMFFYDCLIRLRPPEPIDKRIVIVGLTEEDIENLAQLPISDSTLAQLIDNIRKYNPRVIGMDLHRNVATGSGYHRLKSVIQSTPNLVGVEKTNQGSFDFPTIPPNPAIAQNGMSSASDFIVDSGDVVRRGYLYVSKSSLSQEQLPSFGLKVALQYLEQEGIKPTSSGDKNHYLKLGSAVFSRLRSNQEFYQQEDIDNYQVIVNFRSTNSPFRTISFSDILNERIERDLIKDKIVLIGAFAPTLGDNFFTPESRKAINFQDETFGVEIHAHQTSQIISATLNDRKIIKLLPSVIETCWVLVWIVIPSTIVIMKVTPHKNISNLWFNYVSFDLLAFISIILLGYLLLLTGYWIPLAHPIIALISSFILGISYIETIKEKRSALFLSKKLEERTEELSKTQKKLIAREKLLAYEKLSVKMAHEIRNYLNAINIANSNCQYKIKELEQFIEDNSFLFEDIYESSDESPKHLINYFNSKFSKTENNIKTISSIVESILVESVPDNSEPEHFIDLNQFIDKIVKENNWIKTENDNTLNITLQVNYASNLPKIKIVPIDLERVLVNLLANARDSLMQKTLQDLKLGYLPTIGITTSQNYSTIEIRIRDNGIGITKENIDKVFNPFWTIKSSANGVGVGLFFSLQKIKKYQGKITLESKGGEWTEFTITLPIDRNSPKTA